jgi:hypothetical protein
MAGTVVSLDAKEGQTLNANYDTPLVLQIADLDTMTVWTDVSEADVVKLREGMSLWFTTLGRPDRKWHATLRQIQPAPRRPDKKVEAKAATQSSSVVLYTALFDVPNKDGGLKAGMTAQVFFVTAATQTPWSFQWRRSTKKARFAFSRETGPSPSARSRLVPGLASSVKSRAASSVANGSSRA